MLVRVVLESVGAAATALGPALAQPGTLLRLVLLPTLERIGAALTTHTSSISLHPYSRRCCYPLWSRSGDVTHPEARWSAKSTEVRRNGNAQATPARWWQPLLTPQSPASARTPGTPAAWGSWCRATLITWWTACALGCGRWAQIPGGHQNTYSAACESREHLCMSSVHFFKRCLARAAAGNVLKETQ